MEIYIQTPPSLILLRVWAGSWPHLRYMSVSLVFGGNLVRLLLYSNLEVKTPLSNNETQNQSPRQTPCIPPAGPGAATLTKNMALYTLKETA